MRFAFSFGRSEITMHFGYVLLQTVWNCTGNTRHDNWLYWYNPEHKHKFSQWSSLFPHFRRYGCKSGRISRPCGWYFCNVIASVITNVFLKAKLLSNIPAGILWFLRASTSKKSRIMWTVCFRVRMRSRPLLWQSSDFYPLKMGVAPPHLFARFGPPVISIFFRERRRSYDGFVERILLIIRKNCGYPTSE